MKGKRTKHLDFKDHVLTITKSEGLLVYTLAVPNSSIDSIKYINTNGIMAVTGDYSNWIFCREFHPGPDQYATDSYWKQKLKNSSCQEPAKYDGERTHMAIQELLSEDDDLSAEDKEDLKELMKYTDDEFEYTYQAFRESGLSKRWDLENIPFVKTVDYHFLAILDGFDEICRRLKEGQLENKGIIGIASIEPA